MIGHGEKFFKKACQQGLEGIISKRLESFYQQSRSKDWIKSKCLQQQEFVIGGFTNPAGSRKYFGSLLLGYYDKKNQLNYSGHVGTGFDEKTLKKLSQLLRAQQHSPFINSPAFKNVHWVKPKLVAEVKFQEWTKDFILRQPVFLGLRLDKKPKEVTKDITMTPLKKNHEKNQSIAGITLSHPDKLFYDKPAISKFEVASYYEKIAKWVLPHITNRFLTLLRCPEGATSQCFYQKHLHEIKKTNFLTRKIKADEESYVGIKNIAGLITLVQLNVLEIHPWGSSIKNFTKPDRLIFDIDPGENATWREVVKCALLLRKLLQRIHLKSFVKTTGGKGLHVVVPIIASASWDEVSGFARMIADHMAALHPDKYLATMSKAKRVNKIYIDYLRNKQGANAIAPYSTRARTGAPVATPLSWAELPRIKSSSQFTVLNIEQRLKRLKKDPWEGFFKIKQKIKKAG